MPVRDNRVRGLRPPATRAPELASSFLTARVSAFQHEAQGRASRREDREQQRAGCPDTGVGKTRGIQARGRESKDESSDSCQVRSALYCAVHSHAKAEGCPDGEKPTV
ncbi:predicted protein [Postia placenta Mad-698-R]|nr:predicted protein [Postia placenta Mad-698-R]